MQRNAIDTMPESNLHAAFTQHGSPIPTYCDGYGPVFVFRNSLGIMGIVRAQTWEDAWGICEDEFQPEADETVDELQKEYGFRREHVKIVRDGTTERPAVYPDDYPGGRLSPALAFVRWDTVETPDPEAWTENELFQESYGFRPNGRRDKARDPIGHGIYSKDLNGEALDVLTPDFQRQLGVALVWETV